jgi:hypothetical protein
LELLVNLLDMSATYNPIIQQNATWEITLTLKNPSPDGGITPGTPFNLTGYTGQSQIKAADGSVLASPTVTIMDTTNGVVKISMNITQTASLAATSTATPPKPPLPVYDVLIANTDLSKVFRILGGSVTVNSGVTHWTP